MKNYQYFLLDWDGNLAKTLDIWLEASREALRKRGFEMSDEQIGASFGAFIPHMHAWGVPDPEIAMEEADRLAKQKLPEVELYPDALAVLQALHEHGKHLALITTSPHVNVAHLLEKYGIAQLFEAVVAGDDVEHHKPHPEPLEKGLDALGGTKDQAVMIGDSDKDLGAARNFGIDSILFFPPEHKKFYNYDKLMELQPTQVVADFKDILKTL